MSASYETVPMKDQVPPLVRSKTKLLHLPRSKPLDVIFEDIRFKVSTGSFYNKRSKVVLKGVTGRFCSGELTAIMGPSGAGKSSLLNILTGFQRDGMEGRISSTAGGRKEDGASGARMPLRRKDCCYIMQDDNLTPLLTVREIMTIAADLKLDQSFTRKAKVILVENIMDSVGLTETSKTQCKRLSGGQRKRLSVALELITNPPVMFLDEPTTGLDSQSTLQIVSLLQSLAREGRNIVCTVHQPSATVFEMFDHIYIIGAGYCVYQGSAPNVVTFLQSVGLPCPQYHNPADFVMDVVSGEFGDHNQRLMDTAASSLWRKPLPALPASYNKEIEETSPTNCHKPPSELYRFGVLLRRSWKLMFRDWTVVYLKIVMHLFVGVMVGLLFQQCGIDGDKSVNNVAYILCSCVYLSYTSLMPAILKFPSELGVIKKEQFNSWYKLRTFYIAFQVTNLPVQMFFSIVYVAVSYYLTSQIMELWRFLMFLLVNVITIVISECIGLGLGTSINPVNGIFMGAVGLCFTILMAGFLALLKDMPRPLYYVTYASHLRYTLEAMVLAIYSYGRENLMCNQTYCHYSPPGTVLDELDMRHGDYWRDVEVLLGMAVFSVIYAYYSLRSKMKWSS